MKQSGYTLIEVMVVVAIIGIIAAIAWPMYESQSMKNTRKDGILALTEARSDMEKCYGDNASYNGCFASMATSDRGLYTITPNNGAPNGNADTYTLTAAPAAGHPGDAECGSFTITHLGVKGITGTGTLNKCWSK